MDNSSLKIIDQGILSRETGLGAYMPSITQLVDGTFVACQHVGSELASADNRLEVLRSADGRTWINQGCPHAIEQGWSYRGPDIEQLPDGRLLMTATRFENDDRPLFDPDSEALQRPEMVLFWSQDQGLNWTDPQIIAVDLPPEKYTWNKAGRLIQFSSHRWMFPFETWKPAGYLGPPDQKAAAVFSTDQGKTWGELTPMSDDESGQLLWWDQLNTSLADGRVYVMLWTHLYGTKQDLNVHWIASSDEERTWSRPEPTNLPGQVCCPIALPDGRVAAVYNHRGDPASVRVAVSNDLSTFHRERELPIFDAGAEATLGLSDHENFLAEHMLIGFGKPQGIFLPNEAALLTCFWCTTQGVTHTRWVKVGVS